MKPLGKRLVMEATQRPSQQRPTSFLTPFLQFLDDHRETRDTFPEIYPEDWKTVYSLGLATPETESEKAKFREVRSWISRNSRYRKWLRSPSSMYAPREYILPELRELLIVSPRFFGAHFFPLYNRDILAELHGPQLHPKRRYKYLRPRFTHKGLRYLVAHCHGVSLPLICKWSGKSEEDIIQSVIEAISVFVDTLPYWIWAHRVDMRAIPFTALLASGQRSKFKNRLITWNSLNDYPQFSNCQRTKALIPKYLQSSAALSFLPKNPEPTQLDTLFLECPTNKQLFCRNLSYYGPL